MNVSGTMRTAWPLMLCTLVGCEIARHEPDAGPTPAAHVATAVSAQACAAVCTHAIQPPVDTDLLIKNANGKTLIKLDQDGLCFGDAGGEPIPVAVSAARANRDLGLEATLVGLGLVKVVP